MATGNLVTRKGFNLAVKVKAAMAAISSVSGGPFTYRETVTGGTSSATGTVIWHDSSNGEIFIRVDSGTFQSSETITGGDSGATATLDDALSVAYGTDFTDVARARDNFGVDRSRANQEITDFDTAEEDFVDNIRGNQTGSASTTVHIIPGGTSYQLLESAFDFNLEVTLKREQTDRDESNTRTRYYTGGVTQFNESDSVTDASTASLTFTLDDTSHTDPTT